MSEIPPLMSDTPPPMTKLDWEDDEDFLDYHHLTMEMPSESSLSPESEWNPIDKLPFDADIVHKPTDFIGSSFNSNSPCTLKNDQSLESSISERNPSSPQNDASIWQNEQNILMSENIGKKTGSSQGCNGNESDNKTENKVNVSSENIKGCSKKIFDDLSVTTLNNVEQLTCVTEKKSTTSQYLSYSEHNLEVDKHSPQKLSIKNNDFKHEGVKELIASQTINVQNKLSNSGSSSDLSKVLTDDNNTVVENGLDDEFSGFCDFEYAVSKSLNAPSPIKTFQLHSEIEFVSSESTEPCTLAKTVESTQDGCHLMDNKLEKSIDTVNSITSTIQNQPTNVSNFEHELDSEFNEFCDFHRFYVNENEPICVSNYVGEIQSNTLESTETKHSNVDQVISVTTDNNSLFESDTQNNIDNDDDNFCEFESGYTTYCDNNGQQTPVFKQNDIMLDSKSLAQNDYKTFCVDVFQEYHKCCEVVDLQNLDTELNNTEVWQNLKDIESSPALNYSWPKSEANNVFLSSLSIDSRNIFYGASLNINVPRFAANMSNSPLEPLKASINLTSITNISQSFPNDGSLQDTVPDPEFDWKTSGLVNPLDFQPQTWQTSADIKDESFVKNSADIICDNVFDASQTYCTHASYCIHASQNILEHPRTTISLEAQRILDVLPDFDVLEKPYLVILENGSNKLFLN